MKLTDLTDPASWMSVEHGMNAIRAVALVLMGWLFARITGAALQSVLLRTAKHSYATLARRIAFTTILGVACATALQELGFDLSLFVGAAGVLTVALGFASQTSASNVISGLFLLTEGSLTVGDVIKIGTTTGQVVAIDLLSVKIRTPENLLVRVPNEMLVKGEITNLTRFPIRRAQIDLKIAYKEDLRRVKEVLLDVTEAYDKVLRDPEPSVTVEGFSETGVDVELGAWLASGGFIDTKTELLVRVKEALDRAAIELAVPGSRLTTNEIGVRLLDRTPEA